MNRREFIKAIGAGALSLYAANYAKAAPAKKPNIVLLLIDDLGHKDLGCYGSTFYETPVLDRLATQSMLFTNAYSACPVCSPTRASLMTGKDTARVGFTGHITKIGRHRYPKTGRIIPPADRMFLPIEEVTIANALKPAGYKSASIGKWHLGDKDYWPEKQGFDLNIAGWTHGSPPAYFYPYEKPGSGWNASIPTLKGGKPGEYLTDRLTDETIKFIDENKNNPFFVYLTHYAVHTPLQAPKPLIQKYTEKLKTDKSQFNATYAAMIESVDTNFGRVLDKLDQLNLTDNTIIIVASDNGGLAKVTNNQPLRAGKGYLYEGGIRVPFFVKWPGKVKPGTVCDTPVTSEDIYPTIMDMVGPDAKPHKNIDGLSLAKVLTGNGKLNSRTLYWYYPHYSPQSKVPGSAVRDGDYKLIEYYDPVKVELYNLKEDISEKTNLAQKMPAKVKQLQNKLKNHLKNCKAITHTPNPKYKPKDVLRK
ncbi:MAG: sulfatase [Deltaproteobacteria bacterium]|nr:sulfatase [Deltaproteobacteria bacterium]